MKSTLNILPKTKFLKVDDSIGKNTSAQPAVLAKIEKDREVLRNIKNIELLRS